MILRQIDRALDGLVGYVEAHDWAAIALIALMALAVSTADGWFR